VSKPVQGDVVVSETLGNFALEEHLIENMEDAKRFLKPGGVLMPLTLTQYVVPVVSDRLQREIDIWGDVGFGVDLRAAREVALHNMYVKTVTPKDLWPGKDAAQVWDRLDFHTHEGSQRKGEGEWNAEKDTTVYGFCLYWECELSPGIVLSTSPWEPATHWEQIYLPLLSSLRVTQGETLRVTLTSDTRHTVGVRVTWQTGSQLMDTKKGCI
jgi:protein arginine N-methyltransferase 1